MTIYESSRLFRAAGLKSASFTHHAERYELDEIYNSPKIAYLDEDEESQSRLRDLHSALVRGLYSKRGHALKPRIKRIAVTYAASRQPEALSFCERTLRGFRDGLFLHSEMSGEKLSIEHMIATSVQVVKMSDALREYILLAIIGLADIFGQFGLREVSFSDGTGAFSAQIENYFCQTIPLVARQIGEFSRSLHRDVALFISAGGQIEGDWGTLRIDNMSIIMVLKEQKRPTDLPKRRSKVLK